MKTFRTLALATAVSLVGVGAMAEGIFAPNLTYRTGPFAATGIPLMDGQKDYMTMLNERDGGIGGVPIMFEECETGYSTEKGVECYERTKANAVVTQPWSTGITLQVLPKTNTDMIPILAPGYGFSPMANGKVFQWAFNPPASYWDAASMIVQDIAAGDLGSLNGKKIALLHLDHPFGKEPIPVLEAMAAEYGFELVLIPVGLKEMQNQSAQWLQIRKERPDNVVMWGWGAMNAGAITEAVKTKYPMDQFIGVWWSGHDADLKQVGEAGKGYKSISWSMPQPDAPLLADLKTHVYDKGMSEAEDTNAVFYQRGLVISMILAEAIAKAQEIHGTGEINAAQLRDGLENLDISEARLEELGMSGMVPPFSTSCDNHTGHSGAWMLEWDGEKFVQASDLLMADAAFIAPLEAEKSAEYAEANAPWPVNESCN
ncbi:amino acid/amide ABC transporter substrate-binding protein (HAAT family) [Aliiruegeria haliotis]|uniref:Amino acid/amide ABC transporter substrate-binding protein (HAAT family) n=1 Tax=Aliiruegeria haliotis TaxID=1280846 RepID=A0A2T0RT22_9RHOB|nr:ABC transporter substrate-binding protein [Aliiruegeria haliotis]PRY24277.1 amino acid/amide ABC transporter substrate-binding protein (HAAT family) [Aliiruegeria haliotis]